MNYDAVTALVHLLVAMAAGGLIGLERSYFGRPAGLRTHTLVCMASSMLMLVTLYQTEWFSPALTDTVKIDPTRMAQGIMTGIGFLGAGVIMKDRLSVRGLTTAASIWITAAIGILAGVGLYGAVAMVTILALSTLSVYRLIERRIPMLVYFQHSVSFRREETMPERELRDLINRHGFGIVNMGYTLTHDGEYFAYHMMLSTRRPSDMDRLARALTENSSVVEFKISPTGD